MIVRSRSGFTLLEVVLAIALATMAVGAIVTVFSTTTVGAKIAQQAEASSQVMALVEKELEQGNAQLTAGGRWEYGDLPAVIPVSRQDLNRYRLQINKQGLESFAGGGEVVRYKILLCAMPVGADEESCSETVFRAPPPPVAASAGVTTDTAAQLIIGGEDPTGGAQVVASDGTNTQTYTSYGTYSLGAGYTVTADDVVNSRGIRYSPEIASGGGAVQVYYKAASGAIVIDVGKDEPRLTLPQIDLSGPGGFSATVSEGENRFEDADPGTYQLNAPPATYGGYDFAARYSGSASEDGSFQVARGVIKRVSLRYVPTNGKLRLEFKGGGPTPHVALKKKVGTDYTLVDSFALPSSKSFDRMDPATYSVALDRAYLSGGKRYALEFKRYDPTRRAWTPWFREDEAVFDLVPGLESVVRMRAYPVTGTITVKINAPSGAHPNVTLSGPALDGSLLSRNFTSAGSHVVNDLAPGAYSIEVGSGRNGSPDYYRVSGPDSVTLAAGESKTVTLDYARPDAGTLIYFSLSTQHGPRWTNEPTAYKTAIVEPHTAHVPPDAWVVHRSFRPFYIPPGKDGWVCKADPIEGAFITYEVLKFLDPSGESWQDCLHYPGHEDSLYMKTLGVSIATASGYVSNEVNVIRDSQPSDFSSDVRIDIGDDDHTRIVAAAKIESGDLSNDPNAASRWRGHKEEQIDELRNNNVQRINSTATFSGVQCDMWTLSVRVIDPDGVIYHRTQNFSRQETAVMNVSGTSLLGKKLYQTVYASCP